MQIFPFKNTADNFPPPQSMAGDSVVGGNRTRRNNRLSSLPPSSRIRPTCTCSNRPGSVKCSRHGYVLPSDSKLRRHHANKEILRRALSPPNRKMTLRWWNFRPTPSRLSNMSTA